MAGITTPFTTPTFPFLQTVSQRALDTISPAFVLQNGPSVAPIAPTPTAGLGQGVFAVDGTLGSGYVQQWNASVQRELTPNTTVEVAYVGSKITHVGIPDTNLNQLTVDQLALGDGAAAAGAESVLRHHPAVLVARRSDDSRRAAPEAVSRSTRPSASIATTSARRTITGSTVSLRQRLARGLSYLGRLHAVEADGRRVVGVRRVDPDRPGRELSRWRTASTGALERDYSTGDIPHVFVSSVVWDLPAGAAAPGSCTACSARSPTTGR